MRCLRERSELFLSARFADKFVRDSHEQERKRKPAQRVFAERINVYTDIFSQKNERINIYLPSFVFI